MNFDSVTLNNLAHYDFQVEPEVEQCNPPPKLCAPAGQPQKLRLTAESRRKQAVQARAVLNNELPPPARGPGSQRCRICGNYGHNRKTCSQKHVISGGGLE